MVADPAKDGSNWYDYVGNRITVYLDPLGLLGIEEAEQVLQAISPETEQMIADLVDRIPVEKIEAGASAAWAYIAVAGTAVGIAIATQWHRLCKVKHPGWPSCGLRARTTPEKAAVDPRQSDPGPPEGRKPNRPNPKHWRAIGTSKLCSPSSGDAADRLFVGKNLRSTLYICPTLYQRRVQPGDFRQVAQSVVQEDCCLLFREAKRCRRIHYSGKLPGDTDYS